MSGLWDSIKSIIGSVAPTIASVIGGPAAGAAVNGLCGILGLKADSKPEDIEKALQNASPEFWLKLKEFEFKYKELEIKEQAIHHEDRVSARMREVNMSESGQRDYTPTILALTYTLGYFVLLFCLFHFKIPSEMQRVFDVLVGGLTAVVYKIADYYLGTSKSSSDKTKIMGRLVDKGGR